jgi:hypothetical protein
VDDDAPLGTAPQRFPRMHARLRRLWRGGMTQAEISAMLGISQSYASRILNGHEPLLCDHCLELVRTQPDNRRLWADFKRDVLGEPGR